MKGQSGLEKWEILKFPLFSHFLHFWLSRVNQKAVEAHLRDSGPSRWYLSLVWMTISSFKKNIMVLLQRRSWGPRPPWKYLSEKNYFFQKFSLYIMPKHVSRWILMVSFSFWPYDQKREKCHFSDFVILTKKIANNVFCKYSHYNLHKNLSTLGTWISQIPFKMTDLQSMWVGRIQKSVNQ